MPDKILVIDNNSSDGTHEYLSSNQIDFIHSEVNTGSAGGWNLGINYALNNSYEFIWLMDDDGYPDKHSLENLEKILKSSNEIVCLSSLVIDCSNLNKLAIPLPILDYKKLPILLSLKRKIYLKNDKILNKDSLYEFANFFNGALIKTKAIKEIGSINKDFFLYGEEVDFFFRLRQIGRVYTLNSAIHYHPNINKPWTLIKIYFYLKNSIILNYKYYDKPFLRSLANIFIIYVRVFKNNGFLFFSKLFLFKHMNLIYSAIYRGFKGKIGNDYKS
tara:strand:+ start:783 stop:1604 length:822 start_codon:yes stop_codon:yes gene_type:complete